ncbi:MAG: DsrE family protein [Gallionellaceae bacterium]|nr:DsrE family protein [Gallionellaceae bacterium]
MKHTLMLALWLAACSLTAAPANAAAPAQAEVQEKVVYHINDASVARTALRNIENHLNASPGVKIVVVTHGKGIDFLLNDAKDDKGAFEPQVAGLKDRGVTFDVCRNTLKGRKLDDSAVIMEAQVVPSGVAEIGRLQAREGYVYLKP